VFNHWWALLPYTPGQIWAVPVLLALRACVVVETGFWIGVFF
jgi:hypothetical protein